MIIINLKGGLGNQLFQYATGRALQLRRQDQNNLKEAGVGVEKLKLDITGYGENNGIDTMRRYALSSFKIEAEIATREEIKKLKYPFAIFSKGWRFFKVKVLRQFNTGFNKRIFNYKKSLHLDGFFQTERNFIDKEERIRSDLTLKSLLSSPAQKISDAIKSATISISLHVRRGDYANDKATNKYWGTCDPEYYAKALEYISTKINSDPHIFVFSDDIAWVKENITIPYPSTYVSTPKIPDYEELVLMSQCRHNIIANSSFGWWGAWLNQNHDKIVVAPSKWTLKDQKSYKDIIPSTWHKI